jgi:hypothetical protein
MKLDSGIFLFIILMITFSACKYSATQNVKEQSGRESAIEDEQPEITFVSLTHDFGKIAEGEKVGWYFEFRNTGRSDLIITSASASCGCTIPEYEKKPVHPGGEGTIRVVFDSSGREGIQMKTVTVESNARTLLTRLELRADVIKRNEY